MIRNALATLLAALALAGCATPADDISGAGARTAEVGILSTPNLIVTGATHVSTCTLGQCTVRFNVTVKNTGTATAINPYAGAEWSTTAMPITGCSSVGSATWRAIGWNGTNLAPGASMTILVYGPGYVGPKSAQGSTLPVKFGADPCNNTAETSETDNTLNKSFVV